MFKKKNKLPDGRKYRLTIMTMLILLAAFGVAGLNPALAALYPQLVTALLGLVFVYCGGNIGNKFVSKNGGPPVKQKLSQPARGE